MTSTVHDGATVKTTFMHELITCVLSSSAPVSDASAQTIKKSLESSWEPARPIVVIVKVQTELDRDEVVRLFNQAPSLSRKHLRTFGPTL